MCSPTSAHKPNSGYTHRRGTTSGSSREQSDYDDLEMDGGSCGQSVDPLAVKKIRRYFDMVCLPIFYSLYLQIQVNFIDLIVSLLVQDGFKSRIC